MTAAAKSSIDANKLVGWRRRDNYGIGSFTDDVNATNAEFELDDVSARDGAITIRLANYHTNKPLLTFARFGKNKNIGIWANDGLEGVKFWFEPMPND